MVRLAFVAALALVVSAACGSGNVFELKVGECFDDPTDATVTDVEMVDCEEAHDNEAYAGIDYGSSILDYSWLVPTPKSWEDGDDREVLCIVYDLDLKKLTGSVKNSGM